MAWNETDDWVSSDDPHYEDFDGDEEPEEIEDYDHWSE
jgi:hypothetical protein